MKVYREWVCSMIIPFHINGGLIKPCRSFCERVEQRCPHLHPYGRGQYAGEPVFLCIDPNIPFNPSITPITPYGDPDLCYDSCHLLNSEHNSHSNPNYMSNSDSEDNKFKEERLDCKSNSELLHKATNTSTTAATTVT
ncbi:unnamed protein product [Medioppia subpectinata]|uniref:FZ domain-containing protein n=1 Tax=Medioppia subpectinata TaxID=1979941 RepID=A0A7R9QA97_9ACAR|nr:unnamed protein product [Medioppia subpectinata]CAG2116998.1 unnamed protein product [Medioppia subpectinata]